VTGNIEQDHLKTLEEVLQRLDKHNVRLKSEVTYLGHTVSANGIQPIQNKIETIIKQAPPSANLTEFKSFLVALQNYAKFVSNLSTVLHPPHDRLKAGVEWSWDIACDESFNQCKRLLSSETETRHSFVPRMQANME